MKSYDKCQELHFKADLLLTKPVKDKGVSKGLRRQSEGNYIQGRDGR